VGLEFVAAATLSLLFAGAGVVNLWRPIHLERGLARQVGIGTELVRRLAITISAAEIGIAFLILIPSSRAIGVAAALVWCMVALAYQIHSFRASTPCGCLGGFDPLQSLGPGRWFIYLAPYITLTIVLMIAETRLIDGAVPLAAWSLPAALASIGAVVVGMRQAKRVTPGQHDASPTEGAAYSRRTFLRRTLAVVAAIVLLPTLGRFRALAATCGAWSCVRYEVVCLCCGCSNNRSCDGCYQRRRRTCQGSYGTYVQEQLVTSVCYANICSPCGRAYVSSCGRCCPCPI
jgi:hypothetical protein